MAIALAESRADDKPQPPAKEEEEEQEDEEEKKKKKRKKKKRKNGKKKKHDKVKYLKIAGSATNLALNIAACVVNPFNAGAALSSFMSLVNLVMTPSGSAEAESQAEEDDSSEGGGALF